MDGLGEAGGVIVSCTMKQLLAGYAVALGLVGCSSSPSTTVTPKPDASAAGVDAAPFDPEVVADASSFDADGIIDARPYTLHVPASYVPGQPTPLLVMFHGYGASGPLEEAYFDLTAASDTYGFLYAYGSGLIDQTGNRYWNATNACCDIYHSGVDDVAYFDAIVDDVTSKETVDPKQIYVIGHSNGGFMTHRLACQRTGTVAAIVSLAGAVYLDPTLCTPSEKISVAEVHGNADETIFYDGGTTDEGVYPSAPVTVATWAAKNGCTGSIAPTGATLDLDTTIGGNQTTISAYAGCPAGIDVQLWTINGGPHVPQLPTPGWGDAVWAFLSAHPKH